MKISYIICILSFLAYAPIVQGAACPFKVDPGEKSRHYLGRYDNKAYGFSTRIPAGLVGVDSDDPSYQRGFVIVLPKDQGTVSIFAERNSAEFGSALEAAQAAVHYLEGRTEHVISPTFSDDRIGSRSASRVSAEFRCPGRDEHYGFVAVLAVDTNKQFVYTLAWEGPLAGLAPAENILGSLQKSWRFSLPQ